jgi:hypothetical protein
MVERYFFNVHLKPRHFILSLYLISNIINILYCDGCYNNVLLTDTSCFNNVLIFNSKKYRAGHFVTYKNGDMIVEFSDDGNDANKDGYARIFYGLKKNGRYFFPNESPTREIINIGKIDNARGRYESLNQIVVAKNDINRDNEYLFSTSSYDSLTELHNMNTNEYVYAKTTTFLGKLIFSFRYSMVEVKYNNEIFYFIGFTHSNPNQNGDLIDIQKIGFKSFSLTDYHSTVPNALNINKYNRIVNLFVLENYTTLVLVYINRNNYLVCKFFNYNLVEQGSEINIGYLTMEHGNSNSRDKDGVFFKSVELPDNQRAFALFYNGI